MIHQFKYNHDDSALSKSVWRLYESAFPAEERRPLEQHLKVIQDSRFYPCIYTSQKSELVAICFYWSFDDFKYLEHFAVHPNYRNQGVGSQIIQSLCRDEHPLILEIESPVDKDTKRRLHFYRRNHFKQTGFLFKQLQYRNSNKDIFLELLCSEDINEPFFKHFQDTIYRELKVYNEAP